LLKICDITQIAAVRHFYDEIQLRLGPVDLWINCAGVARGGSRFDELDECEFDAMLAVNLSGTAAVCREVFGRMRARGSGAIYNIVGAGADYGQVPGMLGYATSKAALQFFTAGLAIEAQGSGITIGSVSPGLVLTEAVAREFARLPLELRPARTRVMNRIADTPEVSARWIVDCVQTNTSPHPRFVRLTRRARLTRRMRQWFRTGGGQR
jgi:NAD(P)-dependent dehydrogenase (short-subunit alcohol dehydrogenase family)